MKGVGVKLGVFGVALGLGLAMGCASKPTGEAVGHTSAAVSGSSLQLVAQAPPSGYVGSQLVLWQSLYNNDPNALHTDVTLTTTVAGNFDSVNVSSFGYDAWTCSQASGPGLTTITCHADAVTLKDGLILGVTPIAAGTVTFDSHLTEGGVEIASFHAGVPVSIPTTADLGLSTFNSGGGTINVGQNVSLF